MPLTVTVALPLSAPPMFSTDPALLSVHVCAVAPTLIGALIVTAPAVLIAIPLAATVSVLVPVPELNVYGLVLVKTRPLTDCAASSVVVPAPVLLKFATSALVGTAVVQLPGVFQLK